MLLLQTAPRAPCVRDEIVRPSIDELIEAYDSAFEIICEDTPEVVDAALALRHQVYCREFGWENVAEHPSGRERDAYDAHSRHALLVHRATGKAAGALRVVLPVADRLTDSLPLQAVYQAEQLIDPARYPVAQTVEVSRFTLSPDFRRRAGDAPYPGVAFRAPELKAPNGAKRIIPHMSMGLMIGVFRICEEVGAQWLCAAMGAPLHRMLRTLGIDFPALGPAIEFHGQRIPCYASIAELRRRLQEENPSLLRFILRDPSDPAVRRHAA